MFDEAALVEGVDSHLLDSSLSGNLVASTALHDGMRDIIEPCEVRRRGCGYIAFGLGFGGTKQSAAVVKAP